MKEELILCLEDKQLDAAGLGYGFLPMSPETAASYLDHRRLWFGPRPVLEERPEFRQLIPYIVLTCGRQIAVYRRTRAGGESRLHNLYSIGFGGHISLADAVTGEDGLDLPATLARAATREVSEEVRVALTGRRRPLGLIRLRESPVDRVHLGVVEAWETLTPEATPTETKLTACRFEDPERLTELTDGMESWSRHLGLWLADAPL